jgi:hypothetical protein
MRPWIAIGLAVASAGCRKEEPLRVSEVAGAPPIELDQLAPGSTPLA